MQLTLWCQFVLRRPIFGGDTLCFLSECTCTSHVVFALRVYQVLLVRLEVEEFGLCKFERFHFFKYVSSVFIGDQFEEHSLVIEAF